MKTPRGLRMRGGEATASRILFRALSATVLTATLLHAAAAPKGEGSLSGRVLNAENGQYLSKAKVTVDGTNIEVLTDDYGNYFISKLPAGSNTLRVSYTGQEPQILEVKITPNAEAHKDVSLGATGGDGTVVLEAFKVESDRFKNAQEIATNEERYSPNIKNVVAADSLGYVPDGNIGDFVKFLPGVDVTSGGTYVNGADASAVNVRGFGAENTAVMIDGMPVSSPSPASLTRAVGLDMLSINNASRVEVIKVATPDMEANSAGGAINLITRSAFEYAKPQYDVDLSVAMNTKDTQAFKKEPGPTNKKSYHTLPGARFAVSIPVTKTLGVSVSLSSDNKYAPNYSVADSWNYTGLTYGGVATTNALGVGNLSNPNVSRVSIVDNPWDTYKQSMNLKIDWRPFPNLNITANSQFSMYTGDNVSRRLQFTPGDSTNWGSDFAIGRLGSSNNKVAMTIDARDKAGNTFSNYIKANYRKGPWSATASASRSQARGRYDDMQNGHFSGIDMKMSPGQVSILGLHDGAPSGITVLDKSGNNLDYTQLSNWVVDGTLTAKSGEAFQEDINDKVNLDLRRELNFTKFDLAVKVGYAFSDKTQRKWGRGTGYQMAYTGPTLTSTDMLDQTYYKSPGWGMPSQQWVDVYRLYSIYKNNPSYFDPNYDYSYQINNYVSATNQTKKVTENNYSYYWMLESRFFHNRLSIVGGVRQQRSVVSGYQPITDSKYNYVKNADGTLYTDSVYINGVRIDGGTTTIWDATNNKTATSAKDAILSDTALIARMKAAGAIVPDHVMWANNGATVGTAGTNSTNLELAKLRLSPRSIHKSRKNPGTPSVNVAYRVTKDLDFKVAWSRETTLPDLESSNLATGGVLATNGSFTINENPVPTGDIGGDGTISAANPSIKPQITDSFNFMLGYYNHSGGSLSLSYYYKMTKDIWETTSLNNTSPDYASILEGLGLDPNNYQNWTINTTVNGASRSKSTGYEAEARQNLKFLGGWGNHFDTFATYTHRDQKSTTYTSGVLGQIPIRVPDKYTAGISFSTRRLTLQLRGTYKLYTYSKNGTSVSYNGQKYMLYNYTPPEVKLDVQSYYRLNKTYTLFASVTNILNRQTKKYVYDPVYSILPEYARMTSRADYGIGINAGVSAHW